MLESPTGSDQIRRATSSPSTQGLQPRNVEPVPNARITLSQVSSKTFPVTSLYQPPVESGPHTSKVKTSASPSCTTHSARLNGPSTLGVRMLCASSCTAHGPILVSLYSVGQTTVKIVPGSEAMP